MLNRKISVVARRFDWLGTPHNDDDVVVYVVTDSPIEKSSYSRVRTSHTVPTRVAY